MIAAAALLAAGCSSGVTATPAVTPQPVVTPQVAVTPPPAVTQPVVDPYDTYLATNPNPALILTREDAQTRALLGCGQQWAPGTVDYVLAQAYATLCP